MDSSRQSGVASWRCRVACDDAQIVQAIAAGEPDGSTHVKPGDKALLAKLVPLLASDRFEVAEEALRAAIATGVPEAAPLLFGVLAKPGNLQLRVAAASGFLTIHPKGIATQIFEALAKENGAGETDMLVWPLVQAIGLMDDPALLGELAKAEARLVPAGKAQVAPHSMATAFLLVRARLGDAAAVAALGQHLGERDERLVDFVHDLAYAKSWAVARTLVPLLGDLRQGTRVKPWADFAAPRNEQQRKAIERFEKDAYVRLGDDALATITEMFPAEKWGFAPAPLRRYAPAEVARVKAVVGAH